MGGTRWKKGAIVFTSLALGACSLVAGLDGDGFGVSGPPSTDSGSLVIDGAAPALFDGGAPGELVACATGAAALTLPRVLYYFVHDVSGSMTTDGKDTVAAAGMARFFDALEARGRPNEFAGLHLFGGTVSDVKIAPFEEGGAKSLGLALGAVESNGAGDSISALKASFESIDAFVPRGDEGTVRWLVLVNDGVPPVFGDASAPALAAQAEALVAEHAKDPAGVRTFVIGLGDIAVVDGGTVERSSYDPRYMGRLALAGRTAPSGCVVDSPDASSMCHRQVTTPNSLAVMGAEFDLRVAEILRTLGECTIPLGDTVVPSGTTNLSLSGDGGARVVPFGPVNGWTLEPGSKRLVIHGASCQELSTKKAKASLVFGCATVDE